MGALFTSINAIDWTDNFQVFELRGLSANASPPADEDDTICLACFVTAPINAFNPDQEAAERFNHFGQKIAITATAIAPVARKLVNPYTRAILLDFASEQLTGKAKRDAAIEAATSYVDFVSVVLARSKPSEPSDCWMAVADAVNRAKKLFLSFGASPDPAVAAATTYLQALHGSQEVLLVRNMVIAALRDISPKKVNPSLLADIFAVVWSQMNTVRGNLALLANDLLPYGSLSKMPDFRRECAAVVFEAAASRAVFGPPMIATITLHEAAKLARSHAGAYLPGILRLQALVQPATLASLTSRLHATGQEDLRLMDPLVKVMTGAQSDAEALMHLGACTGILPAAADIRKTIEAQGPSFVSQIVGFQALNQHGASSLSEDELRARQLTDVSLFRVAMLLRHGIYQNSGLVRLFAADFLADFLVESQIVDASQRSILTKSLEHWAKQDFVVANFMLLPLTENACVQACSFLGTNPLAISGSGSTVRKTGESITDAMRGVFGDRMADLFRHIWGQEGAQRHAYCHGFIADQDVNSVAADMSVFLLVSLAFRVVTQLMHDDQVRQQAFHLWEQRGRPSGDDWKDWFMAEAMLSAAATATP